MSDLVELPANLRGVFFDFHWETSLVWALPTPVEELPLASLAWHLDLTVWSTVRGQGRFDLSPRTVLSEPERFPRHWQKIQDADVSYALELFPNGGRWVILDGYHRLARSWIGGAAVVPVRRHPEAAKAVILVRPQGPT